MSRSRYEQLLQGKQLGARYDDKIKEILQIITKSFEQFTQKNQHQGIEFRQDENSQQLCAENEGSKAHLDTKTKDQVKQLKQLKSSWKDRIHGYNSQNYLQRGLLDEQLCVEIEGLKAHLDTDQVKQLKQYQTWKDRIHGHNPQNYLQRGLLDEQLCVEKGLKAQIDTNKDQLVKQPEQNKELKDEMHRHNSQYYLKSELLKETESKNKQGVEKMKRETYNGQSESSKKPFGETLYIIIIFIGYDYQTDNLLCFIHTDLPGVEVLARTTIIVTNSADTFHWVGYGFRLTIPQGSLPAGVDQCQLDIVASVAGQYQFPDNLQLVSGVFWVRPLPLCQFQKQLTMEIQHCAQMTSSTKLSFVRACCSQESLPYTFKQLEGRGSFSEHSSYGSLELNQFSGLAGAGENVEKRYYTASLYYLQRLKYNTTFHVVFSWNEETHVSVMFNILIDVVIFQI